MKIIEAKSVEEAIGIASKLRDEGQYNWFRGQVRSWPPSSSLERQVGASEEKQASIDAKLSRFMAWISEEPTLAYLGEPENVDACCAILQHYGFPTNYIDFTTDPSVAGFFASDTTDPPAAGEKSVIYCLNTDDLKDFYASFQKIPSWKDLKAEPVTVDVSNLWRLQAQHGHFLFANHAWYRFYDMDRIEFPWSECPAYPPREQIYPEHKSSLEQSLDRSHSVNAAGGVSSP